MSEFTYKENLLLNLILVSVIGPAEAIKGHGEGLPHELDRTVLLMRQVVGLNRGNSDIQEADCRGEANDAHVEYGV